MRSILASASLIISRITGGDRGEYLCVRIARRFGPECYFCRLVARFTEPDHCAEQLSEWLGKK